MCVCEKNPVYSDQWNERGERWERKQQVQKDWGLSKGEAERKEEELGKEELENRNKETKTEVS